MISISTAKNKKFKTIIGIVLLSGFFFLPFLGQMHLLDWDEVNFAEIAREMIILDDYLRIHVNFVPFTEKPPFFFWLQSICMRLFGIGEFAARLPNAIVGMASLSILYLIGKRIINHKFGLLWATVYLGSTLPHLYISNQG